MCYVSILLLIVNTHTLMCEIQISMVSSAVVAFSHSPRETLIVGVRSGTIEVVWVPSERMVGSLSTELILHYRDQ